MGMISDMLRKVGLKPLKKPANKGYWEDRAHLHYYQVVKDWIIECSPGDWIIDVGSRNTPIVCEGEFERRTSIDIRPPGKSLDSVEQVTQDWMHYTMEKQADLVLCLQVLEHLPDEVVGPFARKLLEAGRRIIISVPYKWPEGKCKYHLQDPVDLDKLVMWTGVQPKRHYIEKRDTSKRLIALFDSTGTPIS